MSIASHNQPPKFKNILEYVENRTVRQNAGYIGGRYLYNGNWFDKDEFENELFPVQLMYEEKLNPDTTHIY